MPPALTSLDRCVQAQELRSFLAGFMQSRQRPPVPTLTGRRQPMHGVFTR